MQAVPVVAELLLRFKLFFNAEVMRKVDPAERADSNQRNLFPLFRCDEILLLAIPARLINILPRT